MIISRITLSNLISSILSNPSCHPFAMEMRMNSIPYSPVGPSFVRFPPLILARSVLPLIYVLPRLSLFLPHAVFVSILYVSPSVFLSHGYFIFHTASWRLPSRHSSPAFPRRLPVPDLALHLLAICPEVLLLFLLLSPRRGAVISQRQRPSSLYPPS